MATDGPVPVEQSDAPPPAGERKGFLGRFRGAPKSAEQKSSTTPPKEALPGKMGKVMVELKKKDTELDGDLISEFGEGETKFIALTQPLSVDQAKDLPNGEKKGKRGFDDFLIVTPDGFKVLRIKNGEWGEPDNWSREKHPEIKDGYNKTDEDKAMPDIAHSLIRRGNARFREDPYIKNYISHYSLEGSGYSKSDRSISLNFGGGPPLEFFQSPYSNEAVASFQNPSDQLRTYLGKNRSGGGESADRGLRKIRGDQAQLILSPDAAEVTEIIQLNVTEAKAAKDRRDAAKLADEAKKIAEAEAAKKPETDRLAAEDAKRQQAEKQAVAQSQAADSALDILGKL